MLLDRFHNSIVIYNKLEDIPVLPKGITMSIADVYARVIDGKVTEYPVIHHQIALRRHPVSFYHPCKFGAIPTVPNFHFIVEVLEVRNQYIKVSYDIKPIPLGTLLSRINDDTDPKSAIALRIRFLIISYMKKQLDKYAVELGFPTMQVGCNFKNKYDKESIFQSRKCQKVNDQIVTLICRCEREVESGIMSIHQFYNRMEAEAVKLQIPDTIEELVSSPLYNENKHHSWFQIA